MALGHNEFISCISCLSMSSYVQWSFLTTLSILSEILGHPSTHWGRVTHICVSELITIDSHNGLSPDQRQAIIWTNAGILLIPTLGTNFNEFVSEIHKFSLKKMHLKILSTKWWPFCLGLNLLTHPWGWDMGWSWPDNVKPLLLLCFI